AATRGSCASAVASLFSAHPCSSARELAHGPNPLAPLVSRIWVLPAVPFPTACQWNPPRPLASATALAAKTRSFPDRPIPLLFSSYHTVHGTVSLEPVKAMSGATLARVASMVSVGSPAGLGVSGVGSSRPSPFSWKQNPFTGEPPGGWTPAQLPAANPRETKIWNFALASVDPPSRSRQITHGAGLPPAAAVPPATEGSSAVRFVWMLSDGIWAPLARSCPEGSHTLAEELKRLAKMFVLFPAR